MGALNKAPKKKCTLVVSCCTLPKMLATRNAINATQLCQKTIEKKRIVALLCFSYLNNMLKAIQIKLPLKARNFTVPEIPATAFQMSTVLIYVRMVKFRKKACS